MSFSRMAILPNTAYFPNTRNTNFPKCRFLEVQITRMSFSRMAISPKLLHIDQIPEMPLSRSTNYPYVIFPNGHFTEYCIFAKFPKYKFPEMPLSRSTNYPYVIFPNGHFSEITAY